MDRERYIREALKLAVQARERGDHPFGALILVGDEVLVRETNQVVTKNDPTQHAEMRAVQQLAAHPPGVRAKGVLFTSTEPCAMCAAAIYWAGIRHVVYGCPEGRLAALAGDDFLIPCRSIFGHGHSPVRVEGPILEEESLIPHQDFWA